MADQSVHEIQLNGKQLVFMFMSATVAAVVIFLCGVMVGRGVNTPRVAGAASSSVESTIDPTVIAGGPASPAASGGLADEPVSAQDALKDLTYAGRLEAPEPPPEPTVEPVATPVPAVAESKAERPAVVPTAAPAPRAASAPKGEPAGDGFVVQVASFRSRGEAETIVRRLTSKGYPAFVSTSGPRVFRVRVGKYNDRREADAIAGRLEKEEQFKPWITR